MSGCPECNDRPRRWWLWLIAGVVALVAAAQLLACGGGSAVQIGPLVPSPAIQLPRQSTRLALELPATTADEIRIETAGYVTVEVRSLRRTLQAGFERGFSSAFQLTSNRKVGPTLVVEVHRMSFEVERPAVAHSAIDDGGRAMIRLTHGGDAHVKSTKPPSRPRYAVIEFSASLHDGTTELRRIAGQAASKENAGGNSDEIGEAISSAIAAMYERIARDLFANHMATLSQS